MPRNTATQFQNNFIGGFVTQATALDFPPNAAFDQDNVVFSEIGIASRRPGFEFENNFTTLTEANAEFAQSTFLWKNAAGDGQTNIVVQQNGGTIHFYLTGSSLSLSAGKSVNTVSLSSFQASGATTDNLNQNECQYSSGLGYLFVVHPFCDPFYIQYNPSDGSFTSSIISFTVRDVFGIAETGVLVDNRPTTLTTNHNYNLLNQGWDSTKITSFHTAASAYPSNADVWWTYKDDTDTFAPSTTLGSVDTGSAPAPQGYFRLNPWSTARAATCLAQSGTTLSLTGTVDETSGTARPSVTEFHAGRVWYAGISAQGYNTRIYVSTVVQKVADFGFCAATDDPTSSTIFDALATDGLIISIPQAGTIYKLVSLGATMLVFGANGVWAITGSQGIGFTATDFSVNPVSYTRSISSTSYVVVDNSVSWWNLTGINVVVNDPQQGITVKSLSDQKIKDFFIDDIPSTSKRWARGAYNPRTHQIVWLFTSQSAADVTSQYTFDRCLVYNTLIDAFYTWTLPTGNVSVNSVVVLEGAGSVTSGSSPVVTAGGLSVVDSSTNPVVSFGFSQTAVSTTTKYLVSYLVSGSNTFTFAECFDDITYKDWFFFDNIGQDYTSFFTTGYLVKTQGERRFQSNYIFIFNDLSDGVINAYTFQTLWNYGNSGNTGQWTQKQTITQSITHAETNYDAGRRRLKVRGSGTAVQFKFSSVSGQPFNIIGWATADSSNAQP